MKLSAPVFRLRRAARLLSRERSIPLHRALDEIARREGFRSWSHLVSCSRTHSPAAAILERLSPGDMVLVGARPRQGKTLLALDLAVSAARAGRPAFFFTLDWTEADVVGAIAAIGEDPKTLPDGFTLDTSDDICADTIVERTGSAPAAPLVAIDYLQALDQRRTTPALSEQVATLKAYAQASGATIVAISQIDRSFDLRADRLPGLADIRLPNPLDLALFDRTCFLSEGKIQFEAAA